MSAVTPSKQITVPEFRSAKARGTKLAVVTAYDYVSSRLCDEAGVDCILVGDSVGMVVQGHPTSLPVTLDEMIYHTKCVMRGARRALVVVDLPFMTYQVSPRQAVRSAGRLMKEAGAHAVKLEGGVRMRPAIRACIEAGIPVMGHVGMTPQSVHQMGGFKVQRDADQLLADTAAVEEAGGFAVVVESVPADLGAKLTAAVTIPTIGIGAGPNCDGQVLVFHDMLGLYPDFKPKFAKRYADLGTAVKTAVESYCREVRDGSFPATEHTFR
ncbi:3-methyl-2-oxobutanoate hydroxymethyltransferase [Gemmata sp. SH-PL17]|uniref:3-methyl-2-oxobutanoate hydroxymethyltransferase n=1 Tax=Gemmata sp. SH-PL17 TaxID=1630693 RepID=UPI00078DAF87|nr:3-methyl-2-oxobutanoate hydroxymethyltransferase [Gemmata sp. SH-PL17]AMV22908.1 3-methyl-2-oxobutanoate hydroxymethyltransferase [Gemmata sp. SH-PL17]